MMGLMIEGKPGAHIDFTQSAPYRSSPLMGEGDREAVEWVTFMRT